MALIGNTTNAYGQTWHLPCDDNRLTYKQLIDRKPVGARHKICSLKLVGLKDRFLLTKPKETQELLRYYNIFESSKFKDKFVDFKITSYQEGIRIILDDYKIK
jgi:hypothetical protein